MKNVLYDNEAAFGSSQTTVNSLTALHVNKEGLSLIGAAVFIIGEMAGSGILALPNAVALAGWSGIVMVVFCAIISAHAGVYLAECWVMVEEKWPQFRTERTRNPFATIGEKAVGPYMKIVCSFFMDVQLFGVCVVFLILCADLSKTFYDTFVHVDYHFANCTWIVALGLILIPLSYAGSPHDFTFIAYGAMGCTLVSCLLIIIALIIEGPAEIKNATYSGTNLSDFALCFGTILFVYGGACSFPSFQNDMKNKSKFAGAVYIGFLGLLVIYLPIAAGGYAIFGDKCKKEDNILKNLNHSDTIKTIVGLLMGLHLFCAYLICLNPLNLDIENAIKIPHSFNIKRVIFRTCMTLLVIFVALTVPRFGKILNFIGAFSVSAVAYILTPWFYINLCKLQIGGSPKRPIPTYRLIYLYALMILGTVGGAISTVYSAADIVSPNTYVKPCYFNWTQEN